MKLGRFLKPTVLISLAALYISGVVIWQNGPGPIYGFWLQTHSTASLWFLVLFGYLFHAHVIPAWRRGKHIRSGSLLTGTLIFLIITVPFLFYMTNESVKEKVVAAHTYVGLLLIFIFFAHIRRRRS